MKAKSGSGGAAYTPKGVQAFRKMRKAVDSTLKSKPSYSKSRPTADTSERKTSAGISAYKKRQGPEGPKKSSPRPGGIGKGGGKGTPGNKRGR